MSYKFFSVIPICTVTKRLFLLFNTGKQRVNIGAMVVWKCLRFNDLSTIQLYEILKFRSNIFVVEQHCPYPELDDKDQNAFHFCGFSEMGSLLAYARLLPPKCSYPEASIGRVAVLNEARGQHLGKTLMIFARESCLTLFDSDIVISAQLYLLEFYQNIGFQKISDIYLEDGIEHVRMKYYKK
ncbi:MAG: GNAT family N-acetyltransferase [Flavobacteriales bacterium]